MPRKARADWEKIEVDFRAGIKSLREMASEHGITHVAINKKAKLNGWTRDLSARIKFKADELLRSKIVNPEVTAAKKLKDQEIVDAGAAQNASIQYKERVDVTNARSLVTKLFNECTGITDDSISIDRLAEIVAGDDADAMQKMYKHIASLGGRVDNARKLSDALRILVELERKVYRIDDTPGDSMSIEDFLRKARNA